MGTMLEDIKSRLDKKTIHELRQVARAVGVFRPADGKKGRIIDDMLAIAAGEINPAPRSARGAPPKSIEYDRQLVADIERCRELSLSRGHEELTVRNPLSETVDGECEGILERRGDKWFLRDLSNLSPLADVFVHTAFVSRFNLREGDLVSGKVKRSSDDELRGLVSVIKINSTLPDNEIARREFNSLTPIYPDRKLTLSESSPACKVIDCVSPLAAGQRAFIIGTRSLGATQILCDIASGVSPETTVIVLLAEGRPEDYTAFSRANPKAHIFNPAEWGDDTTRCANAALAFAKRQCELSRDSLLIVDDITRLCKGFDYSGVQVTTLLSTGALISAKNFLLSAINAEEGGSITVLSTLEPPSGDPVSDAAYYGLKDLCNMKITLSQSLSRMHIYPPVDIEKSEAEREEKLLSKDGLARLFEVRENLGKTDEGSLIKFILEN